MSSWSSSYRRMMMTHSHINVHYLFDHSDEDEDDYDDYVDVDSTTETLVVMSRPRLTYSLDRQLHSPPLLSSHRTETAVDDDDAAAGGTACDAMKRRSR